MADISRVQLPSGNVYDIKDAGARELISQLTGISLIIAWNGTSTPVVADIPAGVVVTYNGTDYTGTLAANSATPGSFYLVHSTASTVEMDVFDEYVSIGASGSKAWERIGSTSIDLSALGALAYKDSVTMSKGAGDNVLGEATTFTAAASAVSFAGGTTDKVLGSDATFTTSVTPTTTNIKATASGTALSVQSDNFLKMNGSAAPSALITGVSLYSQPLVTTTVPNVTSPGSASSWAFGMGSGAEAETLIISGGNGTAPTLGSAITCATGQTSDDGDGMPVGLGINVSATNLTEGQALTGASVSAQPTIALSTGATAGTGVVSVATGISSATTTTNNKDEVTAVTGIGTGTAAAQAITVGTNDKVKVAKYDDLSVSVS